MSGAAPIELRAIETRLAGKVVHDDIDLRVEAGEVLTLVGGSGSGKTTLLRVMVGLLEPTRGEVRLLGRRLDTLAPMQRTPLLRRCGVLFQNGALFSSLSVYDNIAAPLRECGVDDEQLIEALVAMRLEMVGLEPDDARRMPAELSGGMTKRTALARALALDAEVLFADEPTSGLDPRSSSAFVELIRDLRRDLGLTVVLISHDLHTTVDLSDRVAVLADAQLIALGTPDQLRQEDHPFIDNFFGGRRAHALFGSPS